MGALSVQVVLEYLRQLASVARFLHSHSIAYLYWESGNVLLDGTNHQMVKLSNFSLSCVLDKPNNVDIGGLKLSLPPNICPPELITTSQVSMKSDSWGLGCLLFEMLTGKPVLFEHRHEDRDSVHKIVAKQDFKIPNNIPRNLNYILQGCWQIQPDRRLAIADFPLS